MGNFSIKEDLDASPCKLTADGYCLRNEGDYCKHGECNCPHLISKIKVLEAYATCETTIEVCADCNKPLTEPKTDCI